MKNYLLRRALYALPILLGVNLLTFALFFVVNTPDDMARMQLGERRLVPAAIEKWKTEHGYAQPLWWNRASVGAGSLTDTLFFTRSLQLFRFDFGQSDSGRDIGADIRERMLPSLAIALPTLLGELLAGATLALLVVLMHGSRLDRWATIVCVALMSVSSLFYIIAGQYLFAKWLRVVPISGYGEGVAALKFVALPILVQIGANLGAGARWYRAVFLEEINRDYVRAAWARGLADTRVMTQHVLRNALLPILTSVVVTLPSLFFGSLITESFFAIPGLGSYTIDAIQSQDFAIVRAMVFLGAVLYIIGLLLTDLAYAWADPRVRLASPT